MKRLSKLLNLLLIVCNVFVTRVTAQASSPLRGYAKETTIVGIVPIDDEPVSVNQASFELDFMNPSGLTVRLIERNCKEK
jgi:hypothetical protein